ncbi:GcpE protein-domain-containing protein, partial [Pavlovales sp. CCMP2436]
MRMAVSSRSALCLVAALLAAAPASGLRLPSAVRASSVVRTSSPAVRASLRCAVQMGPGASRKYCESVYTPQRRPTRTVWVGKVPVGSEHPIALQTMTTTDTRDVEGTVAQVIACADKGADIVRITVQGMQEAKACALIKAALLARGYETPLVADIHFAPKVALLVAESFDKIRINPGNFMDGRKTFEDKSYDDDAAYQAELEAIEELFTPLVLKCKVGVQRCPALSHWLLLLSNLGRAMRIGTNHGSLSARTLGKFGDTPKGMVESAFEFARICRKHDYHNFIFSMKASNPLVMYSEGWDYPLHLGVTEAGEGEDGRIKSAIGIGSLLQDGLGDTVRVSLTEDPELEMGPCRILRDASQLALVTPSHAYHETFRDITSFDKRRGVLPEQREGDGDFDMRGLLHRDGS